MTDTWGIPGPAFAGIYLTLLLIPAAYAAAQAGRARTGTYLTEPLRRVDEVAMLAGGPDRVADTVIAGLLEREQLRIDSLGKLHRTSLHPSDTLGKTAVEFVRPAGSSPALVRSVLRDCAVVTALTAELTGRGLMVDAERVQRAWRLAAMGYGVLIALGVARLISGSISGHPVGFLIVLLLLAVVAVVVTGRQAAKEPPVRATTSGEAALEAARTSPTLVKGTVGAVALGGLANHPDKEIRKAAGRAVPARPRTGRSWSNAGWAAGGFYAGGGGSSCGGGGGASCGGGGSSCGGGGGCGG